MAKNTAAPTTTTRTTIDAICTLTIDCRWDTCIEGITRYQWPRIIAVHAPPSIAAELRKLAIVSACTGSERADAATRACSTTAAVPPPTASATSSGRIDASARPTVAQYSTTPSSERASATSAAVLRGPVAGGRKASATAIRIAASPALNRKNFTPASRDTRTSVKAIPTPRCARKRKRTEDRDMAGAGWAGQAGWAGWLGPFLPIQPSRRSCPESAKAFIDFRPVDHVPPRGEIVRPAVLVLQVVRVLPDIDAEDRFLALHQRAVLVRAALDHELSTLIDHPGPAAAEAADARFVHLFLEGVEAGERAGNGIGNRAGRRAAGFRAHDLPEHRVVDMPAAVIANSGADVFRHGLDVFQQILDALRLQLGVLFQCGVQ